MSEKMGRWWTHDDMSRAITPIYRGPHVSVPMRAHEVIAEHNSLADRCERAEVDLAAKREKVAELHQVMRDIDAELLERGYENAANLVAIRARGAL